MERELLGDPHHPLDACEFLEGFGGDDSRRAQQIEFGQRAGCALDLVKLGLHTGIGLCEFDQAPDVGRLGLHVGFENDDHGLYSSRAGFRNLRRQTPFVNPGSALLLLNSF